jgi:hypothetical protein
MDFKMMYRHMANTVQYMDTVPPAASGHDCASIGVVYDSTQLAGSHGRYHEQSYANLTAAPRCITRSASSLIGCPPVFKLEGAIAAIGTMMFRVLDRCRSPAPTNRERRPARARNVVVGLLAPTTRPRRNLNFFSVIYDFCFTRHLFAVAILMPSILVTGIRFKCGSITNRWSATSSEEHRYRAKIPGKIMPN